MQTHCLSQYQPEKQIPPLDQKPGCPSFILAFFDLTDYPPPVSTQLIITISVLSGLAFLFALLKLVFSATRKTLENHIQAHFTREEILGATTRANFFGELSKGGRQIRGNGALVLTKNDLHFIRAVPFKTYKIPIGSIIEISLPKSFNGKSVFSALLCVQYRSDTRSDAIAWAVKNPENWKKAIENLQG